MNWRPWQELRFLFESVGFRLALNYGLLSIFTMVVLIAVFYLQTVGVLKQGNARQVNAAAQRMVNHFDRGGRPALIEAVQQTLMDGTDSSTELYLLRDEHGTILTGNLMEVPDLPPQESRIVERPIEHGGRRSDAMLLIRHFPDGASLIVGHEMSDLRRIESMVQRATFAATGVTLLLVLGGTGWFRAHLESRVEAIRRTARRISAGDLTWRVPAAGEEDEFARLDRDINQMLDRIEGLMDGVKHVSNAIAHEMRTPLARILAGLRTADRPDTPAQQVRKANHLAIREIESLTQVFDKLLQIAEAESGTRRQHFVPTDTALIMRDVIDLFNAVAEEQGCSLIDETDEHLVVLGDSDLLAGAVANLIDNALKYTPRGARIRVGAHRDQDDVVLTVTDDGPGVPGSALDRLGTRFYRLDRELPGFGLGLTSVGAIVDLHGGSLAFMDAGPGLSVQIRLPALVA